MSDDKHRRSGDFIEKLSVILVVGAFLGAFLVLFDVKAALVFYGQTITIGSGFAPETKGMVLQSMLITALTAVVGFWYGTTKQGQDQAQSVSKIAESAAPTQARAVAAARAPAPEEAIVPAAAGSEAPAVTPAAPNPVTGNVPAAEVATEPPKP